MSPVRTEVHDGTGWVRRLPVPVGPPPPPPSGLRSIRKQPFVSPSPFNIPLPVDVAFEPATSGTTLSIAWTTTANNGGFYVNQQQYSHTIIDARDTDPLVNVTDRNDASRSFGTSAGVRIPVDAIAASGTDGHLAVRQPGSTYVVEFISMRKVSDTQWSCSRNAFVDYAGDGIGPRDTRNIFTNGLLPSRAGNGCRATGSSQMGGLVTKDEVLALIEWRAAFDRGLNPSPVGIIPHRLAIGLPPTKLRFVPRAGGANNETYYQSGVTSATEQIGWDPGQPRAGFIAGETHWNASERDFYARTSYTGQNADTPGTGVSIGKLLGIPGAVDLGVGIISPYEIPFGQALKDYGASADDRAGDAVFYIEIGSNPAVRASLIESSFKARPVQRLFSKLRVVEGNTQSRPGGQPVSAARRRPLAAPLDI